MKLSVIIIARNAEETIADAIQSVNFANEVIVIDNGSVDRTKEVAEYLKAKVYKFDDPSFSAMRNFGLEKARGEWVFYIDTDERVAPELQSNIVHRVLEQEENHFSAFMVQRKNFYFGSHEWPYIEKIERLFKRHALRGWRGKLHESPQFEGKIAQLDGFLLHYTHRNLSSMLAKTIEWSKIEAGLRFKAGHPKMTWWRFFRVMFTAFTNSYIRQGGWRAGMVGLVESIYQAFSMFITYARLWEMQQNSHEGQD